MTRLMRLLRWLERVSARGRTEAAVHPVDAGNPGRVVGDGPSPRPAPALVEPETIATGSHPASESAAMAEGGPAGRQPRAQTGDHRRSRPRWALPAPLATVLLFFSLGLGLACFLRDQHGTDARQATGPQPSQRAVTDRVVPAAADTYVTATERSKTFANTAKLRIDGAPPVISLIQFDLRGIKVPARQATLRIFATSASSAGYEVRVARTGAWDLRRTTFESVQPPTGSVAFSGPFEAESWAPTDVTPLLKGMFGKIVTLALSTSRATNISVASRDSTTRAPTLVLAQSPTAAPDPATDETAVVFAAGDIADCKSGGDEQTVQLLTDPEATVLALGDVVYESGTAREFASCYAPSWGTVKNRTRPAVGNHEYRTRGANGYFDYFKGAAGERSRGYYSFDLGAWHLIALNSNCSAVGGCGVGSPQERWLREDLATHPARCTLAYWHHPRFSSGQHGNFTSMQPIWAALERAGAEIVLSGHDHDYERFAPQSASGQRDDDRGIVEFVVGTGGKNLTPMRAPISNSEVRANDAFGVLRLALSNEGYAWEFRAVPGSDFEDSGSGTCH